MQLKKRILFDISIMKADLLKFYIIRIKEELNLMKMDYFKKRNQEEKVFFMIIIIFTII